MNTSIRRNMNLNICINTNTNQHTDANMNTHTSIYLNIVDTRNPTRVAVKLLFKRIENRFEEKSQFYRACRGFVDRCVSWGGGATIYIYIYTYYSRSSLVA